MFLPYLAALDSALGQDLLDALILIRGAKLVLKRRLGGTIQRTLRTVPEDRLVSILLLIENPLQM
jgi:hypothetical protein